jgi:hypothetical protein
MSMIAFSAPTGRLAIPIDACMDERHDWKLTITHMDAGSCATRWSLLQQSPWASSDSILLTDTGAKPGCAWPKLDDPLMPFYGKKQVWQLQRA